MLNLLISAVLLFSFCLSVCLSLSLVLISANCLKDVTGFKTIYCHKSPKDGDGERHYQVGLRILPPSWKRRRSPYFFTSLAAFPAVLSDEGYLSVLFHLPLGQLCQRKFQKRRQSQNNSLTRNQQTHRILWSKQLFPNFLQSPKAYLWSVLVYIPRSNSEHFFFLQ